MFTKKSLIETWYNCAIDDILNESQRIRHKTSLTDEDVSSLIQFKEFLQTEIER
jgi:hypothetical protein